MKTVSTKLDNSDFEKFQNMCNDDGMCVSESLRYLIKSALEAHEEYLEIEKRKTRSEGTQSTNIQETKNEESAQLKHVKIDYLD